MNLRLGNDCTLMSIVSHLGAVGILLALPALSCGDEGAHKRASSDASDGLKATLTVRTHHALDGSFRLDEELTLPGGDRVRLERADDSTVGTIIGTGGEPQELEVGTYEVIVDGAFMENLFVATRVERRPTSDYAPHSSDVRKKVSPLLNVFGQRDTLIVLIGFPGQYNTYEPSAMHAGVFGAEGSTDALYREASRNKMWLGGIENPEGDIWGPYEVPTDGCSTLSYSEVSDLALDAAEADGIDVGAYQHRVYAFPPVDSCPGGGIGGGNQVWVFGIGPQNIWDWVGHEAAHGFGFGHASSYDNCTVAGDPITIGGACTHNEYGDPTDIQGRRNFQFSSWHMERAGWLEPENVAVVDVSERVVLVPIETLSDQIQSLRVPREEDHLEGDFFHFEYRQPVGFDSNLEPSLTNGVLVRTAVDPNNRGNPHLLDMTPETASNTDATLTVGKSFEAGNMKVTLVEATAEHAVLDVIIDGIPPDITTPDPGDGSGGSGAASGGGTGAGGLPSTGGSSGNPPGGVDETGGNSGDDSSSAKNVDESGGCGCRTTPRAGSSQLGALGMLLALALFSRWRRRGRFAGAVAN